MPAGRQDLRFKNKKLFLRISFSTKFFEEYDHKKLVYKNIIWRNKYYQLGEIIPMEVTKELQKK